MHPAPFSFYRSLSMGIDIYLKWADMTESDKQAQYTGFDTTAGSTGYLRESYHGGPYATKMLVREAFEAESCEADIPAAVMRERLTHVTEPARGCDGGHDLAAMITKLLGAVVTAGSDEAVSVEGGPQNSGYTEPMTVEEAVRIRYKTLYPDDDSAHVEQVVQSFRDFVSLAERKEKETGKPCTVYASY